MLTNKLKGRRLVSEGNQLMDAMRANSSLGEDRHRRASAGKSSRRTFPLRVLVDSTRPSTYALQSISKRMREKIEHWLTQSNVIGENMNQIRIGGWTRIWLVVSAFFLVVAVITWRNESRSARTAADEQYKSDVSSLKACEQARANNVDMSRDDLLTQFQYGECSSLLSARIQQKREQALAANESSALSIGLIFSCYRA